LTNAIGALGSISRGGALTVQDTGPLVVTGPITGGTITNPVSITTTGLLTVNGSVFTSGANNINLQGNGVTQGAASTVDAGAGTITVNGGGGAITLSGTLTSTNAGNAVTIQNATTVALGNVTAPSGTLVLGVGDISGAITQNSGTALSVSTLTAN